MIEKKVIIVSSSDIEEQLIYTNKIKAKNNGKNKIAYVKTYGCQQNEADSERLSGMIEQMGYQLSSNAEDADLILVNTCAVREHAELKALSITGELKHLKAKNPDILIGICGCMVTQEHRKNDIESKYPYVDFLFGTSMLYRFPEILFKTMQKDKRMFYLDDSDGNIAEGLPIRRESNIKAWVSIMYGCNNFCTYCIVPYVRGRERSRNKSIILDEIKQLIEDGYKEIILLGQNVNSYGKDLGLISGFTDLLNDICSINGDFIVRFMTSHPKDASKELIDTIAKNPKIARQFHLPLQSGNNRVLQAMNRNYTYQNYFELVRYMREKIPNIAVSTDIIVGFPTETDEEFADTLRMIEKVEFDSIYSFIYSLRKGTPAAKMEGQVSAQDKGKRFDKLLATQNRISKNKNVEYINTTVRVLTDGKSKYDNAMYTGRSDTNKIIHFIANDSYIGKFVNINIYKADTFAMYGEIIK